MKNKKHLRLSYVLTKSTPTYKNYNQFIIEPDNAIQKGDSSNSSNLRFNSHTGTHIDFPKHFIDSGQTGDTYNAETFHFNHICYFELNKPSGLIQINELDIQSCSKTEILIIKTGLCNKRHTDLFWNTSVLS